MYSKLKSKQRKNNGDKSDRAEECGRGKSERKSQEAEEAAR